MTMKSFITDLKKYTDKVTLKTSERRELRERVLSYMEYHPLKKQGGLPATSQTVHGISSESFITVRFSPLYIRIASGVFAVILILAPFVAERSVPGDVLYLVKTGFNESIRGSFAFSPYQKIEFETKLMERRIAEARTLASEGKLTDEVETHLAETVKEHTHAVQSGLAELRTQNADEAAIAGIVFSSSLEVQSAVLGSENMSAHMEDIGNLLTVVNEAREVAVFDQGSSTPSFEGIVARIESETTRAYELLETVKKSATKGEITDINRRLSDIDRVILEAKKLHESDSTTANAGLANTLGLIQKLITFMTNIDVRETVALETLVPVVFSDVERIETSKLKEAEIALFKRNIVERVAFITDANLAEKINLGIQQVDEILISMHVALETMNPDEAESLARDAEGILQDLDVLTKSVIPNVKPTPQGQTTTTDPEVTGTTTVPENTGTSTVQE